METKTPMNGSFDPNFSSGIPSYDQDPSKYSSGKSTTPIFPNAEIPFVEPCPHRLPCGICRLMYIQCPKMTTFSRTEITCQASMRE